MKTPEEQAGAGRELDGRLAATRRAAGRDDSEGKGQKNFVPLLVGRGQSCVFGTRDMSAGVPVALPQARGRPAVWDTVERVETCWRVILLCRDWTSRLQWHRQRFRFFRPGLNFTA